MTFEVFKRPLRYQGKQGARSKPSAMVRPDGVFLSKSAMSLLSVGVKKQDRMCVILVRWDPENPAIKVQKRRAAADQVWNSTELWAIGLNGRVGTGRFVSELTARLGIMPETLLVASGAHGEIVLEPAERNETDVVTDREDR